jgi:hypothetical protein
MVIFMQLTIPRHREVRYGLGELKKSVEAEIGGATAIFEADSAENFGIRGYALTPPPISAFLAHKLRPFEQLF